MNNTMAELRVDALAREIEQELALVVNGAEFLQWSSDCRKSWARSIISIIEADGLQVKGAVLAILADIAARGI